MVQNNFNKLSIPLQQKVPCEIRKIGQVASEKKRFKDYTILDMHIAQRQGQITSWRQKFDCN